MVTLAAEAVEAATLAEAVAEAVTTAVAVLALDILVGAEVTPEVVFTASAVELRLGCVARPARVA